MPYCKQTMNDKKTITIDLWKAVVIMVTAMLGSAGAGLYSAVVTINSDHYILANNVEKVEELQGNMKSIMILLGDIKADVAEIKGQIKNK